MSPVVHPFQPAAQRRAAAIVEFRVFREEAPARIKDAFSACPRGKVLKDLFSFYVDEDQDRVQAWFGSRSMFRKAADGKLAVEEGVALLYSRDAFGHVGVTLYPCRSNVARTHESGLLLRAGRFTAHQLLSRIPADVADLVAYGHVSSPDSEATIGERFRIWLLRKTRRLMDGENRFDSRTAISGYAYRGLEWSSKALLSAGFMSVLKPLGLIAAITLVSYLGILG